MTRRRPLVSITLSPEAIARLAELAAARGLSRSALVDQMIRAEDDAHLMLPVTPQMRRRIDRAAYLAALPVATWARAVLDQAASAYLEQPRRVR